MYKILIADDEPNILALSDIILKEAGVETITAMDGEEAIQKAKESKPDLIISDIVMPKKTGFDVCKEIRNSDEISDIPVILLSALGSQYSKLTGFECGADEYMTKPFNVDELKERAFELIERHKSGTLKPHPETIEEEEEEKESNDIEHVNEEKASPPFDINRVSTGIPKLDQNLGGGLPKSSNILLLGGLGQGKSYYLRSLIAKGLAEKERCLFVTLDDAPSLIRSQIGSLVTDPVEEYERKGLLRFVDAYSWSSFNPSYEEQFSVKGVLDLNQLASVIADSSQDIGQSIQHKLGGFRVIDSISSLLVQFDLPAVQRFLTQIARTSVSFGGVTTFFVMEDKTVDEQILNNIKYVMDGVIEFKEENQERLIRVSSMKWTSSSKKWVINTLG